MMAMIQRFWGRVSKWKCELILMTIDAGNLQPRGTFVLCIVAGAQDVLIKKM
jgi:hypothetical protein